MFSSDMSALQVAIWLAVDDPSHIERGLEDVDLDVNGLPAEVIAAEANREIATHNLSLSSS